MTQAEVSREVDLLIVGAGIYGACAAHVASGHGLRVLVVDRGDFGAAASSSSLKVAHGGLRYLQSLDLRRYLESIRERRRLQRLAPEWVRPQRFRLDLTGRGPAYRGALRAGLLLNELGSIHRNRGLPAASRLPRARYPEWYDALIQSTERVLMRLLLDARDRGAGRVELRNYASCDELVHANGALVGARLAGLGYVRAREVMFCTGAAAGDREALLAINLVVDPLELAEPDVALGLRHRDDQRNLFVVPWRGRSMIGTYYRRYPFDRRAALRFEPGWVDEALAWMRAAHPALAGLERGGVRFVHAGLLPAGEPGGTDPADTARISRGPDGALHVQGVKWTTAYGVAERAVERALHDLGGVGRVGRVRAQPGAFESPSAQTFARPPSGSAVPSPEELHRAVDVELARTLEDVLLRRTELAAAGHPGRPLVEAASRSLQPLLDWSERERAAQVDRFHECFHFAGNVPDAGP